MALIEEDRTDLTTLMPEVGVPRWEDIPIAFRKVISRAARLQRLVSLGAPQIIIRNEQSLLARGYIDLGEYINRICLDPATEYAEGLREVDMGEDLEP
jgi:hypothetical protein